MARTAISNRSVTALISLLALWPADGAAQETINPTRATFTASADHEVTHNGIPLVQSYEIGLYFLGASEPFQNIPIGKPDPDATGTITVDLTSAFLGWPVVGTSYTADVAAVGPGGRSRSPSSNTFRFLDAGACTFTVSTQPVNPTAAGGAYTINVAATGGCFWTAVSNAPWIDVTSGAAGIGAGDTTYIVAINTATSPRTGTLTIAGTTLTVTQEGAPCSFALSSAAQPAPAVGASLKTTVTTNTGCAWTAVSDTSWIDVTSGAAGTGEGDAVYTVAENTSTSPRTGTLTIAGTTVTVTQDGGPCSFTLSSAALPAPASGGSLTTTVTTSAGCEWTTTSNTSWITVTSGSAAASGTARFTVQANPAAVKRSGTLTIAGQTVTITQAAASLPPSEPTGFRVIF